MKPASNKRKSLFGLSPFLSKELKEEKLNYQYFKELDKQQEKRVIEMVINKYGGILSCE